MDLQTLIDWIGHGLCHQLPERTLEAGGWHFAVCARDTGIHIAYAAALVVAALQARILRLQRKPVPADLPPLPVMALLGIIFLPMALDGLSSYLGFRETTNLLRYFTGLLAGLACGTLSAPLLASATVGSDSQQKAFAKPASLLAQLLGSGALASAFWLVYPHLGAAAPLLGAAAMVTLVATLNLLVLVVSVRRRPIDCWQAWLPWLGTALLLALAEISLLSVLRYQVIDRLLGLF
ncbi:MAG: DUF2085 domain-containing protein [Coriobacteriia bacterium]|nr:DUF2085 domain-containing protein [Coriobacteriia bacterium]